MDQFALNFPEHRQIRGSVPETIESVRRLIVPTEKERRFMTAGDIEYREKIAQEFDRLAAGGIKVDPVIVPVWHKRDEVEV